MSKIINLLTFSRIILSAIIFLLITFQDGYMAALILFYIAAISDFFDGYLARKYDSESILGEILDPIADKILLIFVLFALAINLSSYFIGFIASIIITERFGLVLCEI